MRLLLILAIFGSMVSIKSAMAQNQSTEVVNSSKEKQTKKRSRRKKVLMCQECGKPESECECEGHGNNETHQKHETKKKTQSTKKK